MPETAKHTAETAKKPLLGAHMPTSGGCANAVLGGKAIGCDTVQLFTASPRQWRAAPFKPDAVQAFLSAKTDTEISKTVAHDSYLINLAAAESTDVLAKSRLAFRHEIERADLLCIDFLVSHPGAHLGAGTDAGIAQIIESLDIIHAETAGARVRVAIETTAGQGTYLGGKLAEIARILNGVKHPERLAVCLDTCHVFVAGYNIRTAEGYNETMAQFDEIIGLAHLQVIHANDSKGGLGSHLDRHEHIGDGEIGLETFRMLVNDPRFFGIPMILETPDSETMHAVNLQRLRALITVVE